MGELLQDTTVSNADSASAFYREGEYWTIAYAGTILRLRDAKGLHCLAYLLGRPGVKVGALELLAIPEPPSAPFHALQPAVDVEDARVVVTKRIKAAVKKIHGHHPSLAHHLGTCIKTGAYCSYVPDPAQPPAWAT